MGASNVVNLRPRTAKPYDHATERGMSVVLSELEWSIVVDVLNRSGALAADDLAAQITTQVRTAQSRRLHPLRRH